MAAPAPAPTPAASQSQARPRVPWLARLQQSFVEGKRADMVIRVRIGGSGSSSGSNSEFTDIPTHSLVLCTHSAYFDKALTGAWTEAAKRRIELVVEDEEELADLQLLLKLCYSESFAHDGGQLLPLTTRLRLAARADALEFVEAVDQLVMSLSEGLSFKEAQTCLDELPPAVEGHAGIDVLRSKALAVLAQGIKERAGKAGKEEELQAGTVALAKYLGPITGMFEGAVTELIEGTLPLKQEVKQLTSATVKALLESDSLLLQSENEAYALLMAWLHQSPHVKDEKRSTRFKALAPLLRYHHMTPSFLANVVAQCPLMQASGLLPAVIQAAFGQLDVPFAFVEEDGEAKPGCVARDVGPAAACWELGATFTLAEVQALEPGGFVLKWCGLVAGYPVALKVGRSLKKDTLSAYMRLHFIRPESAFNKYAPTPGVCLVADLALSPDIEIWMKDFFDGFESRGWCDVFDKPWAEAMCESSPHFPNGTLKIKATVKLLVKEEGREEDNDDDDDDDDDDHDHDHEEKKNKKAEEDEEGEGQK